VRRGRTSPAYNLRPAPPMNPLLPLTYFIRGIACCIRRMCEWWPKTSYVAGVGSSRVIAVSSCAAAGRTYGCEIAMLLCLANL
jgi:hypothetical protein